MKKYSTYIIATLCLLSLSCKKQYEIGVLNTTKYTDTEGSLKAAAANFPIGIAIDYAPFINDAKYKAIVAAEAKSVTFGYHMKHGAIVRSDGSMDFSRADQLYDAATAAGLEVFGHTLGWHANQNAAYLNIITAGGGSSSGSTNLLSNGSFELGTGDVFNNWSKYNGGANLVETKVASEVQSGSRALKCIVAANGNPWSLQLASDEFATTIGKTYIMTFFIRSQAADGKMRISTGGTGSNPQYSNDFTTTTAWEQKTYSFIANGPLSRVLIDIGSTTNTYFVDNVVVADASAIAPPTGTALYNAVDSVMKRFIVASVTRYKGKVKAWDVVNEPMIESGRLRTDANTTVSSNTTDVFFWSKYLGRDWALNAFKHAAATDPAADLYINEYNLESNPVKLDSLLAYVTELKSRGAKISGIGTQMHISWNNSLAGIDNMFKKMAATGLKVRISELDVRVNPQKKAQFVLDEQFAAYQAQMYNYIVKSYLANVPKAQQSGITIWGVTDDQSWLSSNGLDFPLLFNKDYSKKPAYSAVLEALKGK